MNPNIVLSRARMLLAALCALWLMLLSACAADSAASSSTSKSSSSPVTSLPDRLGQDRNDDTPDVQHPLHKLYTKLQALEDADPNDPDAPIVRITQIGDSHTASDTFTGPVRTALQKEFGDGGRGYLAAGKPWERYRQRDARYDMSSGWSTGNGIYKAAHNFALSGVRIWTDRPGEWISRSPCPRCQGGKKSSHLQVVYLQQPDGGQFDIHVGKDQHERVSTASDDTEIGVFELPLPRGEHTVRIETVGDGTVTLFSTSMLDRPGVIYDSIGVNGAQLRHFLAFDPDYGHAELAALESDVVMIAFGANETMARRYRVSDPATQSIELLEKLQAYHKEIVELLERYQEALPDAECIVLLPPDMLAGSDNACIPYTFESEEVSGERCVAQPATNFAGILNALRYAARSAGCAVWDQQQAMGGEGGMDLWIEMGLARKDGVHLRTKGYDRLAEGFTADLLENYRAWRRGEAEDLTTHVIFPELATTAREEP